MYIEREFGKCTKLTGCVAVAIQGDLEVCSPNTPKDFGNSGVTSGDF